jgi:D-3-phosphoglycerate dehydrogenase
MTLRPKVLLTLPMHQVAEEALSQFADIIRIPNPMQLMVLAAAQEADAVIVRSQLPDDIFDFAPRLRLAVRHGTGIDMIPLNQANAAGVLVSNVPGVNARSVAEYAIWAILGWTRRFHQIARDDRLQIPNPWFYARAAADLGHELQTQKIGLVGYGAVGRQLACFLKSLGCVNLLVHSRREPENTEGLRFCDLDTLLGDSDVVVLALPLSPQTRHLINERTLGLMKPDSLLLNIARGGIVDHKALLAGLENRRPGWAVLDVHETHPLPVEHPFWRHPRVTMTPHVAGISDESMLQMGLVTVDAVRQVLLHDELPVHCINPEVWPRRRCVEVTE